VNVNLDELLIATRTVWQESRGQPFPGQVAVAHVIWNRAQAKGTDMGYECHRPWQFSGWNVGDPSRLSSRFKTVQSTSFRQAMRAVLEMLDNVERRIDPTSGSKHFHADYVHPSWAQGRTPVLVIGAHLFYNDIP